jgi:hypothetical protein
MAFEGAVVVGADEEDPDMLVLDRAAAQAVFRGTRHAL